MRPRAMPRRKAASLLPAPVAGIAGTTRGAAPAVASRPIQAGAP
jgi:hypothetical protein